METHIKIDAQEQYRTLTQKTAIVRQNFDQLYLKMGTSSDQQMIKKQVRQKGWPWIPRLAPFGCSRLAPFPAVPV